MTYAEKLKDPRWQKRRLEVLSRDNFKCQLCGDEKSTLHVHHNKYKDNPWDIEASELITFCKHCHSVVEGIKDILKDNDILQSFKSYNEYYNTWTIFSVVQEKDDEDMYSILMHLYHEDSDTISYIQSVSPKTIKSVYKFLYEVILTKSKTPS